MQTDRGVIDTEGVLARLAQVEEADACHIGNGKHVIVCIIRGVSVMWDGAHNCNGNRFHLFGWSILFGVPSKLSAKLEVWLSIWMSGVPIRLCAWSTACRHQKLSQTVWAYSWL